MKTVILYDETVEKMTDPDHRDVLEQVRAVGDVLRVLGYAPVQLGASLDLAALAEKLKAISPAFVFNLVESISGTGRLIHLAPTLLEFLRIPYTGASADTLYETSNKAVSKRLLQGSNLPTPKAFFQEDTEKSSGPLNGNRYLIKSVWEHASIGLGEDSVLTVQNEAQLRQSMTDRKETLGGNCFAEEYIEGREFNLSLLTSPEGPELLPPAEILFDQYPPGKPRIVDYKAKWDTASFEYHHTSRTFQFPPEDEPLLNHMGDLAKRCWSLFRLAGYARVDFRVDRWNHPWILEVNANPCLSPDAGFAAAATRGDVAFHKMIERIAKEKTEIPSEESQHSHGPETDIL